MKKPAFKKRRRSVDNRGSGIVSVLISVAFVTAIGAALLYMSFMNYQIKVSDRASRANFYDTETALSEIRAGLQALATQSIAEAYTTVLTDYDASSSDVNKTRFAREFVSALGSRPGSPLSVSDSGAEIGVGSYVPGDLLEFIREDEQENVTISGPSDNSLSYSYIDRELTLKALSVTYEDSERGYKTTITTDILIKIPDFSYTLSDRSRGLLYKYIIVADEMLEHSRNDSRVNGDVYAGNISLSGGRTLSLTENSTIISGRILDNAINPGYGTITIHDNSKLDVNGELWARQIELTGMSSAYVPDPDTMTWNLNVTGTAHVADDLAVLGDNFRVKITGSYYGFGQQSDLFSSGTYKNRSGLENSSILVSGRNTYLNFTETTDLKLAGYAFINGQVDYNATTAGERDGLLDVLMGTSMSARTDQLAYLAPVEHMTMDGSAATANPVIVTARHDFAVDLDAKYIPVGDPVELKSLNDFGARCQTLYFTLPSSGSGDTLAYTFLVFDRPGDAKAYYEAYYQNNKAKVDEYLNYYFNNIDLGSNLIYASGAYYTKAGGDFDLASGALGAPISGQSSQFLGLISGLSISNRRNVTPFNYFVNAEEIGRTFAAETGVVEFSYENSDAVSVVNALIIPEGYYGSSDISFVIDDRYPNVNVIIAMGNVQVDRKFEGLIMSTGTVTLHADLSSSEAHSANSGYASAAFSSTDSAGRPLSFFMNDYAGASSSDEGDSDEISWDLDKLVVYKNWTKN